MNFFKDFKNDFSKAVNEFLPENKEVEDISLDQMVNTLDSFETMDKTEADADMMKELLNEFTNKDHKDAFTYMLEDSTLEEFSNLARIEHLGEDETMKDNIAEDDTMKDNIDEDEIIDEDDNMDDNNILVNDYIVNNAKEEDNLDVEENVDMDLLEALNKEADKDEIDEKKEMLSTRVKDSKANVDDVTHVTKGTVINGSIISNGSLNIMGTVNGDVECLGKLSITGKVIGDSRANDIFINTERLEGNITSEGSVKIGLGTVVIGNIIANSGVIAGAVKGEIDIKGPIVIDSTAIIKGNINAKSVQINNGAVIEGFCSLSHSSVDVENIFE